MRGEGGEEKRVRSPFSPLPGSHMVQVVPMYCFHTFLRYFDPRVCMEIDRNIEIKRGKVISRVRVQR